MEKTITRKWYIFTESGIQAIPFILDLSNEDVNDSEIAYCIQEQIFNMGVNE